jgi:hypothetical protein
VRRGGLSGVVGLRACVVVVGGSMGGRRCGGGGLAPARVRRQLWVGYIFFTYDPNCWIEMNGLD